MGVAPGFFGWFFVGILPQVFRYSLFLSTGFDRIFIRHLSTNSDKFRPRQKVQTFDTVRHRHLSPNFDKFRPLQFFDKFRPIPTNSLFFDLTLLLYADIQKVYIFLTDKFRACSPFLFVTSQFYYNTKIFENQPHI